MYSSKCNIHTFQRDDKFIFVFEDLGEGTSVTNASEELASFVVNSMSLKPEECRFFERYPANIMDDTFDEVTYEWEKIGDKYEASDPDWNDNDLMRKEFFNEMKKVENLFT